MNKKKQSSNPQPNVKSMSSIVPKDRIEVYLVDPSSPEAQSYSRKGFSEVSFMNQGPKGKVVFTKDGNASKLYREYVESIKGRTFNDDKEAVDSIVNFLDSKGADKITGANFLAIVEANPTAAGIVGTTNVPLSDAVGYGDGRFHSLLNSSRYGKLSATATATDPNPGETVNKVGASNDPKLYNFISSSKDEDDLREKLSSIGIVNYDAIAPIINKMKEEGPTEEYRQMLAKSIRSGSQDVILNIDDIVNGVVDWAGGIRKHTMSEKEQKTGVRLIARKRGGIIPKYSIVKKFKKGGQVPFFQEGGEMTPPGAVEEGAQVQGGEQIFSVEDTQQIIQMVQQIIQTQDQNQQMEMLVQLGIFVVEAVMRQMQGGEQTTTTEAPAEQPETAPAMKKGGKLYKKIMDSY